MYHFVWITKYHHKVFVEPYRKAMKTTILGIRYDFVFDIQELEIPEEHIQMVIKGKPKIALSYVMQMIKISQQESFLSNNQR
jgi:putative transposase